ncbi:uncharacterized protein EDB93DRAFT_1255687 [Suillus bovinus]|uniref:uncharacterized protein n=1 Tax=Suillus bovinus TaxID=48563 RepID=UPI001B8793A6|nr:uncharacterized protein EDB93DRAFT_1255687 [Suillus bovinus]KAG2130952.1 hypothetical protein EDB93DRAFT_1255687 [Suillus bovinus]
MSHSFNETTPTIFDLRNQHGVYDALSEQLLKLPSRDCLAQATYNEDFIRQTNVHTGNFAYVKPSSGVEYEGIIMGQITGDEKIRACGTHYAGTMNSGSLFPRPITNKTPVKSMFSLCKPEGSPKELSVLFDNQLATLLEVTVIQEEEASTKGKTFDIRDWIDNDLINIHTEAMYAVPKNSSTTKSTKRAREDKDTEMNDVPEELTGVKNETPQERTTDDLYNPDLLSDYKGPLYQHNESKLRQLDIRDTDNSLIHPEKWYTKLRRGALVLVNGTLHTFTMEDNRRIYHIHAHTIRVLDESDSPIQPRMVITLPGEHSMESSGSKHAVGANKIGEFKVTGKRKLEKENEIDG